MQATQTAPPPLPRHGWQFRGVVCGYFASIAMLAGLLASFFLLVVGGKSVPDPSGWIHPLTDNALAAMASDYPFASIWVHLVAGVVFALIYARWAQPRLVGPDWWRGLIFAMGPCLLSLVVFFPLMGAGLLGFKLGAGPLPIVGNLILHAIYGLTLGWLYGPISDWLEGRLRNTDATFRWGASGLMLGTAVGLILGEASRWLVETGPMWGLKFSEGWMPVTGLLLGSALGCSVGLARSYSAYEPPPIT